MNATVADLTARMLLGRRRAWLLLLLPLTLLVLALILRLTVHTESREVVTVGLLQVFGLGTIVPLLGLIAGTGAIGPEIDDGSIVYLLSKPLNRHSITVTKLLVAIGVILAFAAIPVMLAGWLMLGTLGSLALAFGAGAAVAGTAYCAVFLLLAVVTRHAVVIGLLYALLWESLIGGFVPGAQALSIQQWSLAITEKIIGPDASALDVIAAVGIRPATVLLLLIVFGATALAGSRLRSLRLVGDD